MSSPSDNQPSGKKVRRSQELRTPSEPQPRVDAQPFDNIIKALFGLDGTQIVPELLAEAQVTAAHNVEIDRSKLKADLVFKILYKGLVAILNLELQSGADPDIGPRLLQYMAGLHDFYKKLPILCIVIYLFRCQVEMPPYIIECADKRSVTLDYDVIKLWEVDSEWIVKRQIIPMYILLPGTKAPQVNLLKQVLQEMSQVYKRHELGYRFMWFYRILRRTDTMLEEDKLVIEKVLKMQFNYEEIIQDDPVVQDLLAETRLEGEIKATKENIFSVLTARFSAALAAQAQPAIIPIQNAEILKFLFQQLLRLPDEQTVRIVLGLPKE